MIINAWGEYSGGEKGPVVSFMKNEIQSNAGAVKFLDDDTLIFQDYHDGVAKLAYQNIRNGVKNIAAEYGLNELTAGGYFWVRWFGGPGPEEVLGVTTSDGQHFRNSYVPSLSTPDGSFAVKEIYQSTGPWYVQFRDKSRQLLSAGEIGEINLLTNKRVVFRNSSGKMDGINLDFTLAQPLTSNYYSLKVIPIDGIYWYLYQDIAGRLLFHPIDDDEGYILSPENSQVFRPTAIQYTNKLVMIVWATREDELPHLQEVRSINLDSERIKLIPSVIPIENNNMIPAFEKPIWQAPFFSHSAQYGDTPLDKFTGNAIWLRTSDKSHNPGTLPLITCVDTVIADADQNLTVAYWESAGDINALVARVRVAASYPEKPIIAYLDGDGWPDSDPFDVLNVWPSIQAYRFASELLTQFNARVTAIIERVQKYGLPLVLTTRFDDFNGSQSIDKILECMPLYDNWLRIYNFVGHMPFSDRRGNGISSNADLWNWARTFQYAIPAQRPNRYDYWRPSGLTENQILDNKLGQSRAAIVLEPYLREYIKSLENGVEPTPDPLEWPDLLPIVEQVRAKYPAKVNVDQCVAIVNEIAKTAPPEYEFGLLRKDGGNHGTQSGTGIGCSVDWIVSKALIKGTDCLVSTPSSTDGPETAEAKPTWPSDGEWFDVSRWVRPI